MFLIASVVSESPSTWIATSRGFGSRNKSSAWSIIALRFSSTKTRLVSNWVNKICGTWLIFVTCFVFLNFRFFRLNLNSSDCSWISEFYFDSTVIPSLEQTSYSTSDSTPLQSPAEWSPQSKWVAAKIQKDVIQSQYKFNYSTFTDGFHQEQKPQQHITDTNENTLLLSVYLLFPIQRIRPTLYSCCSVQSSFDSQLLVDLKEKTNFIISTACNLLLDLCVTIKNHRINPFEFFYLALKVDGSLSITFV